MGRTAHFDDTRGLLIVNPRSGSGSREVDELVESARRRGVRVHLLRSSDDVRSVAEGSSGPLGAAGGDGSLSPVAEVAIERDLPFVCIPLGTRNHFARDVGLDRSDPLAALDAFESGSERRIDVGRAGERVFLNNVSIGLYAALVHRREAHRRRRETFAWVRALWLSARDRSPEPISLDGERLEARLVLIANNAYEVDLFDLGAREQLDDGRLHAYIAREWLPRTWEERVGERFVVERVGGVRAALDGEPVELDSTVELTIQPRALRVLLPS